MYQNAIVRKPAWSDAMVCEQQHFCLSTKWLNKLKRLKNMSEHTQFSLLFPFWLCLWWFKAGWKMLVLSNRLERIQHVHWLKTEVNAISSVDCKTKFRLFFQIYQTMKQLEQFRIFNETLLKLPSLASINFVCSHSNTSSGQKFQNTFHGLGFAS